jgi:hypothetical protein
MPCPPGWYYQPKLGKPQRAEFVGAYKKPLSLSLSLSLSLVELNFKYHSKNITGQNYLFRRIINFYNTNQYIRPITKHIFTFHLFIILNWTLFYINLDKHEKV